MLINSIIFVVILYMLAANPWFKLIVNDAGIILAVIGSDYIWNEEEDSLQIVERITIHKLYMFK